MNSPIRVPEKMSRMGPIVDPISRFHSLHRVNVGNGMRASHDMSQTFEKSSNMYSFSNRADRSNRLKPIEIIVNYKK